MTTTRRQAWVLLAIVSIDVAAKLAAFRLLAEDEVIHNCILCLALRVNQLGAGSAAQALAASYGPQRFFLNAVVFDAVLVLSLLITAARWRLTKRSVAISIIVALLSTLAVDALKPLIGPLSYRALAIAARISATILWAVIWICSTQTIWKWGALLWTAAGFSNSLSNAYPPYDVVDYLWSSPMNRSVGLGVFNLADGFWLIGFAVFAVALAVAIAQRTLPERLKTYAAGLLRSAPAAPHPISPIAVISSATSQSPSPIIWEGRSEERNPPSVAHARATSPVNGGGKTPRG